MRTNGYRPSNASKRKSNKRLLLTIVFGLVAVFIIAGIVGAVSDTKPSVLTTSTAGNTVDGPSTVPWDYKIEEAKVGDLIGADMTILPSNQLLPNDQNYGTGDAIWVLSYMTAEMATRPDGQNDVTLSAWEPLKSFKTKDEAQKDLEGLKMQVQTTVDLVGVYKTEYEGKTRQFAMLTLPTGHTIKQPVTEEKYASLKEKKQVQVVLEEVHDFGNYDLAMSKFRGWAE